MTPTIEDLTITKTEGRHGLISRVCWDPEPWDPWENTDCYEGVKAYGPSRFPRGMDWGDSYEEVPELIRLARLDGWTVIPTYDLPDTTQADYYETDAENANGFVAVRMEAAAEWHGNLSRRTLQRKARHSLRAMIEERQSYYRGEVYGFTVERGDEVLESVWGYFRDQDVEADAAASLAYHEPQADHEQEERQAWAERDVMTV